MNNEVPQQSMMLNHHIATIVEECLAITRQPEAIVLYGSYGRGEGAWYQAADGKWHPYNDYDLCLIARDRIGDDIIKSLKTVLAGRLCIRWVDICQFHPNSLRLFKPSIFNYDLKYASKVIYGNPDILDNIPRLDSDDLPLKEVETLFFTRLYALIGSVDEKSILYGIVGESSRFFRNQMAKAILAIVDSLLLAKSSYHASYITRVNRFSDLYPEKNDILKLSQWALREKLHPCDVSMTAKEVNDLYGEVCRAYFRELYPVLTRFYRRPIRRAQDIENCLLQTVVQRLKIICWRIMRWDNQLEQNLNANVAQCYIAESWIQGGISDQYLKRAVSLINAAGGNVTEQMTWDEARYEIARIRMAR